jgi:hypothetical protein
MKQVIVVTGASSGFGLLQRTLSLMRGTPSMPACVKQRAVMRLK